MPQVNSACPRWRTQVTACAAIEISWSPDKNFGLGTQNAKAAAHRTSSSQNLQLTESPAHGTSGSQNPRDQLGEEHHGDERDYLDRDEGQGTAIDRGGLDLFGRDSA